jgi:acyloxyacyl hydrolase
MSAVCLLLVLCVSVSNAVLGFGPAYWTEVKKSSTGGGVGCIACTIVVGLLEQLAVLHNAPVQRVLDDVCKLFPAGARQTCEFYVAQYGVAITKFLEAGLSADEACHGIRLCTNPSCALWSDSTAPNGVERRRRAQEHAASLSVEFDLGVSFDPWKWITDLLQAVIDHRPEVDLDGDGFSDVPVLRGSDWRGKDCDDLSRHRYAGRKVGGGDGSDHDCNGIYGTNPASGRTWESELCDGVPHYGVMSIGDSAGAHFEIPPSWMTASEITNGTYDDLLDRVANELDLPYLGGYTAFRNSSTVPTDSLYKSMLALNRCIHRDFQSLCVNGARSGAITKILETMSRNTSTDHPALVFFELIGNDVCSGHATFSTMTSVTEFRANIMTALRQLDTQLPPRSRVVTIALADGEVLWEWLHNRTHPIGVPYEQVYDFLNCLGASPCWGWMNSNATVRNLTQIHANALSAVYADIIAKESFQNFEVIAMPFPLKEIEVEARKYGLQNWQLIEPIDGFHPNAYANAFGARWTWKQLQTQYPSFIPPANPNNAKIMQLFGDQGGY